MLGGRRASRGRTPYQAFLDDVAAMTTPAASDNVEAIEKTEVKPEA